MKTEQAFTLLELLVTMTIIAILTAFAVPQYRDYKEQAFDLRASSDLRIVSIAEEAYYLQAEKYLSCQGSSCSSLPGISTLSQGVELTVEAEENRFIASASHPKGSGKTFHWDSDKGGLQS